MTNNQHKWITAQIGAREHYLSPVALARHGALDCCFTDFWAGSGMRCAAQFSARLRGIANRHEMELESRRVISFNAGSLFRTLAHRLRGKHDLASTFNFHRRYGEWFATNVRDELKRRNIDGRKHRYVGFTTGCLETIRHLRERGIFCVVQQIDPARTEHKIVLEEARLWQGWEPD